MFLFTKACEEEEVVDNSKEIEALKAENILKDKQLDSLRIERDLIKAQRQNIVYETVYKIKDIDSSIAKDSTKALVKFREGLQLWGVLPDGTDEPTFRELGYSSKIAFEGYGFKLQLKECDNEVANLMSQTKVLTSQKKDLQTWVDKVTESYTSALIQLDKANSFWRSPELWFGLGGATVALIVFLAGSLK
jgi:hypothetical protein